MRTCVRWIALWAGGCLVAACGVARPPEETRAKVIVPEAREGVPRVLFVGNSFSFGVPRWVMKESARAGEPWDAGRVAHDSWSLDRHATDPKTLATIREGGWDVVVLQEQSRVPSVSWMREWRMVPAVGKLAAEARAAGAVPVLYQTWGYRDGDPARREDDFIAMNARVRDGYRGAAHATGLAVVPVGDAWEREIRAGRGDHLFRPDGKHPSVEGDQLTAGVFVEALEEQARP